MGCALGRAGASNGKESRLFLKVQPYGGEVQVKEAARISLDGAGGLILWNSQDQRSERVILDGSRIFQILLIHSKAPGPA